MIARADGPFIYDTEGNQILDGMAGLRCVNVGYGRNELAEAAYEQMKELPYYNSFFSCSTPTPSQLPQKIAEIAPGNINQIFYGSSGLKRTTRRCGWCATTGRLEGKPEKNVIIRATWPITARPSPAPRSAA